MADYRKGPDGLNDRERRFVEEYLVDLNGTYAAVRAGYSKAAAKETASRLLTRANVAAAVEIGMATRAETTEVTKDWLMREAIDTYRQARQLEQSAAARGTLHLLALLQGHIVEKRENRNIDLRDMTDEQLQQMIAQAEAEKVANGAKH